MRGLFFLLFLMACQLVNAQVLKGKVMDEYGNTLPGASLYAYNENGKLVTGTTCDENGLFSIKKGEKVKQLKVSFIGFSTKKQTIEKPGEFVTIKLKQKQSMMDEVVLKAYPYHYFSTDATGQLSIQGNHPGLAATFEDPSRALMRTPAMSFDNDQSNAIIYRGMPSHMMKWEMDGAEIINPNHLSNAGTSTDLGSTNAGGVLAVPFDYLQSFSFFNSPYHAEHGNAIAGIANLNPINDVHKKTSFLKIGLIGLEAALALNKKKETQKVFNNLYAHYRYSTVGLLNDLGVDFGGEEIRFQDLNLSTRLYESKKSIVEAALVLGRSSNEHAPNTLIDETTTILDLQENNYYNDLLIGGLTWDLKAKKGVNYHQHLYVSTKNETKYAALDSLLLDDFTFDIQKVAYQIKRTRRFLNIFSFNYGADATYQNFHLAHQKLDDIIQYSLASFNIHPFAGYSFKIWKINMRASLASSLNTINRTAPFEFSAAGMFQGSSFDLGFFISRHSQTPDPIVLAHAQQSGNNLSSITNTKSLNLSVEFTYKPKSIDRLFKVKIRPFYHYLTDVPAFDRYSTINGLNHLFPSYTPNYSTVDHRILGYDVQTDTELFNLWFLNANFSQFDFLKEEVDVKYDYNYVLNLMLTRQWNLLTNKRLFFSAAFHSRSGNNEALIDLESSSYERTIFNYENDGFTEENFRRLNDFQRLDLRVRFDFGKKQKNILTLDIQNLLGRENEAFSFYDPFLEQVITRKQQGLIPIISYTRKL